MSAVMTCECGARPRYRLPLCRVDTMRDALEDDALCDKAREGAALLQPGIREIIGNKYKGDNRHADTV